MYMCHQLAVEFTIVLFFCIGMGTGMGLGQSSGMGMSNNPMNNLTAQQQQAQLQQQIEILRSAPFGDSPLFRNSISVSHIRV